MTHTGPMPESAGELFNAGSEKRWCSKCSSTMAHKSEKWESSDGAYEDYKYTCTACGQVHWVDGIDS